MHFLLADELAGTAIGPVFWPGLDFGFERAHAATHMVIGDAGGPERRKLTLFSQQNEIGSQVKGNE